MFKSMLHLSVIVAITFTFSFIGGCANDGSLEGSSEAHWSWPFDAEEEDLKVAPYAYWPLESLDAQPSQDAQDRLSEDDLFAESDWHWPFADFGRDMEAMLGSPWSWPFDHEYNESNDGLFWHWPLDQLSKQDG